MCQDRHARPEVVDITSVFYKVVPHNLGKDCTVEDLLHELETGVFAIMGVKTHDVGETKHEELMDLFVPIILFIDCQVGREALNEVTDEFWSLEDGQPI